MQRAGSNDPAHAVTTQDCWHWPNSHVHGTVHALHHPNSQTGGWFVWVGADFIEPASDDRQQPQCWTAHRTQCCPEPCHVQPQRSLCSGQSLPVGENDLQHVRCDAMGLRELQGPFFDPHSQPHVGPQRSRKGSPVGEWLTVVTSWSQDWQREVWPWMESCKCLPIQTPCVPPSGLGRMTNTLPATFRGHLSCVTWVLHQLCQCLPICRMWVVLSPSAAEPVLEMFCRELGVARRCAQTSEPWQLQWSCPRRVHGHQLGRGLTVHPVAVLMMAIRPEGPKSVWWPDPASARRSIPSMSLPCFQPALLLLQFIVAKCCPFLCTGFKILALCNSH